MMDIREIPARARHAMEHLRRDAGFTLLELAVTMVAFAAIMVVAFGLMGQLNRAGLNNEQLGRTQAAARAASDQIEKDLRAAGVGVDFSRGQPRFVHADAYQIAFNANLTPVQDPDGTAAPSAVRPGAVPGALAGLYTPPSTFASGAETVVYTLDSSADAVVDGNDSADDAQEDTENPRDMVLYRRVFGWDGAQNTMEETQVALVRGPDPNSDGDRPQPLFAYLLDHDDNKLTPPVLHGDANNDGTLDAGEVVGLTPLTRAEMARLERIILTVTAETDRPDVKVTDNDGFQAVELRSEVMVRHQPRTSGIIYGVVYQDTDGDRIRDAGETGIQGVVVQSSSGTQARTDAGGAYRLVLTPGFQTITETDPAGYISSTPNTISMDVIPGTYQKIDFGDRSPSGSATIQGRVFDDVDQDGERDGDEAGLPGITVYADTGEQVETDEQGYYRLTVQVGARTVTEVDDEGYISSTPNTVDVLLDTDGQVEEVDFGDYRLEDSGTIEGYVFLDENRNGIQDNLEGGVPGAMVHAGTDSVETNFAGFFSLTVPSGTYDVWETDPPGYSSTTANRIRDVVVETDQTVTVMFGDVVQEDVNFDVIELADTERALSITSGDMHEDNRGDADIVLGTRSTGGTNNLLIWHNQRRNSRTPNGALFETTPTATRNAGTDVMTINLVEDGSAHHLVLGLRGESSPDVSVWQLDSQGLPDYAPDYWYSTTGGEAVLDLVARSFFGDSTTDLILGIRRSSLGGSVEFWEGEGGGRMVPIDGTTISTGASALGLTLGEVTAVAHEDINGDGYRDLVVGAVQMVGVSAVHVYLRKPDNGVLRFVPHQSFAVQGTVTDVVVRDMVDDDQGRPDIVVSSATSETMGGVELWLQYPDGFFGLPYGTGRSMDDFMPTTGAPLHMESLLVDNDVFPDLLIGTRLSTSYQGVVELALGFGYLPSAPRSLTENAIGAVVTMTHDDFNLDNGMDLAVGTQNSATSGQVVIFYRQ